MMTTNINTVDFKQQECDSWAAAAAGWGRRDGLLLEGAAPVTERMLELAGIAPGQRVLDIASGTGEPAISAARAVGENGSVVGTDLVDEMLAYARSKAASEGLANIEFRCVDGEMLTVGDGIFDAVTIRWGLMFMPQPLACIALAHSALQTGGRISVACWAAPEKNPFISLLTQTLGHYMDLPKPPPGAPGIFSMADPDRLCGVLESAGFINITLEEMEFTIVAVEDGQAYWEAMSDLAAPVMRLVRQLDDKTRDAFISEVIKTANAEKTAAGLCMRGTTWIAAAEK